MRDKAIDMLRNLRDLRDTFRSVFIRKPIQKQIVSLQRNQHGNIQLHFKSRDKSGNQNVADHDQIGLLPDQPFTNPLNFLPLIPLSALQHRQRKRTQHLGIGFDRVLRHAPDQFRIVQHSIKQRGKVAKKRDLLL